MAALVLVAAFAVAGALGLLGVGETLARLTVAAVIVLALAPSSRRRHMAGVGVALLALSVVAGLAVDAVFALFGPEPWERGSLGPFDVSTIGRWYALRSNMTLVAWASLIGAGVALLLLARWSRGRVVDDSEAEGGRRATG